MTADSSPLIEMLLALSREAREAKIREMTPTDQRAFDRDWNQWRRPAQKPPPGDWRIWLIMAGRGFGKTRTGAEWVHALARGKRKTRIALVAATLDEARAVMVEGESGVLATGPVERRPKWEPSLNRLTWRNGAIAHVYSADNPDSLRGPQHRFAWCDELAKWPRAIDTWDNLMFGLRDGPDQRVLVTTTPRRNPLLIRLIADPRTVQTGGRTVENLYLPQSYIDSVEAAYAGTLLGRQELDGELIEDVEGALWTRGMIEAACGGSRQWAVGSRGTVAAAGAHPRLPTASLPTASLSRILIAVDPPASATGDACGIIVCGIDDRGIGHVLEDASVEHPTPERWARAVSACAARWGADRVIAEGNNGGEMVRSTLRQVDASLPVSLVHASRGKGARAEPVALLYEQRRVCHHGRFRALEDQLCAMTVAGYTGAGSPDRADALVWALTELMLRAGRAVPRVRVL